MLNAFFSAFIEMGYAQSILRRRGTVAPLKTALSRNILLPEKESGAQLYVPCASCTVSTPSGLVLVTFTVHFDFSALSVLVLAYIANTLIAPSIALLYNNNNHSDARIFAKDARKIILNANAFQQANNQELRGFLRYVAMGELSTEYTRRIDDMIRTIKVSEQMRKEYRILPAVIMDAIDEGVERGKSLGIAEGEAKGRSEGSRQAKLETAKNLLNFGLSRENIAKATGLSRAEVEAIQ